MGVDDRRHDARPRRRSCPARPPRSCPRRPRCSRSPRNEPNATFECALDDAGRRGPPVRDVRSTRRPTSAASAGPHTLLVRAVDLADPPNVDPTPASYTWTVIGPPTTTLLVGAGAPTTPSADATFTFEANQPNVTFACSLDGLDFVPCASRRTTYADLAAGEHEFTIRATNEFDMVEEPAVDPRVDDRRRDARPRRRSSSARRRPRQPRPRRSRSPPNEADATLRVRARHARRAPSRRGTTARSRPRTRPSSPTCRSATHTLLVRAVDPSGNVDATPASLRAGRSRRPARRTPRSART